MSGRSRGELSIGRTDTGTDRPPLRPEDFRRASVGTATLEN